MLTAEETAALVKKYGKNEKDTGATEVQIAILTQEIADLTDHLIANKHDYQAKRSLNIHVAKRNALVNYLARTNPESLASLKKSLGLKK